MRIMTLALTAIAIAGCAKTGSTPADTTAASGTAASASNEDVTASIAKLRDAWVDAAKKKDAAAVASMYTDDAVLVGADAPLTTGRAAIQEAWSKFFPILTDLTVTSEKTESSGDLAYDYGSFTQHLSPPNAKPLETAGYYLVVFKKQSDGSWKIARHLSTIPPKS